MTADTRHRAIRETLTVLFFLSLAAVATRPLLWQIATHTLPGPDPAIDLWTLHWLSGHALSPGQLFEGNIFRPVTHAAVYSDLSLGTAVLLVPLRLFISDPVVVYNAGLLLALAFAGWAFATLTRALTGNGWAGLLAGTLAAFGSHQMSHIYHLNLLSTGWLALLLLGLHRLATRPGTGAVLLTGVSFALSAQSSGYYAVSAALLPLAFAASHARPLKEPRALRATAVAALLGGLLVLPYLVTFLEVRERDGLRRPPGMSRSMAFQPERDLSSHGILYGRMLGNDGERLFPGVLSLALAGLAIRRRAPHLPFYASATALLLLVSLGPELRFGDSTLPLPYSALFGIPPLDAMRHPYTFAAVATMLLAVLAGLGFSTSRLSAFRWGGPIVVALAVAETLAPAADVRAVPQGLPPAYAKLGAMAPGLVLEVPLAAPDVMLWAARHGRPVVNGDGAFLPSRHALLDRTMRREWLKTAPEAVDETKTTALLRDEFALRYLIVPCGRQPSTCQLAGALNGSRVFELIEELPDGDRLYEVQR